MTAIKILGAGLSGLACAIRLAKAGKSVEVFEVREDTGGRFLGDLQGLENWSTEESVTDWLKREGFEINFDCDPFSDLTVMCAGVKKECRFQKPLFYLVKRGTFAGTIDQGMKEQALKAGVKIHYGAKVKEEEVDVVAKGPSRNEMAAIDTGVCFKIDHPDIAIGLASDDAAYKGYSYLLITKGYGCVCTVLFDQFDRLQKCFDVTWDVFSKIAPLEKAKDLKKVGGMGAFLRTGRYVEDGRLYVGESAGIQDLLWGFGMRTAIQSGLLAAESILHQQDYEAMAKEAFSVYLKAGVVNRMMWEKATGNVPPFAMKPFLGEGEPFGFLRSWYRGNLLQKVLYPLAWLKLKGRYPFWSRQLRS